MVIFRSGGPQEGVGSMGAQGRPQRGPQVAEEVVHLFALRHFSGSVWKSGRHSDHGRLGADRSLRSGPAAFAVDVTTLRKVLIQSLSLVGGRWRASLVTH